jgi:hypothetical protein
LISQNTETGNLKTNFISPLGSEPIVVEGDLQVTDTLTTNNIEAETVETKELITNDLKAQEATISTLYADNIISKQGSISDLMTDKISSLRDEIRNIIDSQDEATPSALLADSQNWSTSVATDSATINGDLHLSNDLIVGANLMVNGNTQLGNAFISGTFAAGQIAIQDNFIETTNTALYIQPSQTGAVHIMGDTLVIADSGTVLINGDLTVTGSFAANNIIANQIEANQINTQDLASIQLVSDKINIATDSASTIIASELETEIATTSAQIASNASSGTTTLPAYKSELVIHTDQLTENSLIYLTPIGSTNNQVLYIKEKIIGSDPYFTIALDQALYQDIQINWWIIN